MKTTNMRGLPKHTIIEVLKSESKRNPDGGTYPYTPKKGYLVAISEEFNTPEELLENKHSLIDIEEVFFGWYKHKNSEKPVFEVTVQFFNKHYALLAAKRNNQYSIWDCENNKEIVI